jgi:hypothetical protein
MFLSASKTATPQATGSQLSYKTLPPTLAPEEQPRIVIVTKNNVMAVNVFMILLIVKGCLFN